VRSHLSAEAKQNSHIIAILLKYVRPNSILLSLDGSFSDLTKKSGGDAHVKGILIIESRSSFAANERDALPNVADVTSDSCFDSKPDPDQWIC
jgi:hypothetical protein